MSDRLTLKQFCKLHGFSDRYVRTLVKRGMPHSRTKKKRGRPALIFDPDSATQWMASQGIVSPGMQRMAQEGSSTAVPKPNRTKAKSDAKADKTGTAQPYDGLNLEQVRKPGLLGSFERLKLQEFTTSNLMLKKKKDGAPVGEIMGLQKQYSAEATQLRMMSTGILEYRKKSGELVDRGVVDTQWKRIAQATQSAVMSIGTNIMPQVRAYLKDPNVFAPVQELIDQACRDALLQLERERLGEKK